MKKIFLLLMLCSVFSFAQQRIYFDSSWVETTKDQAIYYREAEQKGNLILLKDYYKNGTLQMEGLASDATPGTEVYQGKVTWYFPNGKIQSFSHYKNGSFLGESKAYDEEGRLTSDFVYDVDENFSGKQYLYKDQVTGIEYNVINNYKKSILMDITVYDDNIKGIRTETLYNDTFIPKEIRNYDEKGKLIGTVKYKDDYSYADNSVYVDYYYNPMRIAGITKYGKDSEILEKKEFYKNGKLKLEYKKNASAAKSIYYNKNGDKIGELSYQKIKNEGGEAIQPYDGREITFSSNEGNEDQIYEEKTYEKGKISTTKKYRDNGTLESLTEFENKTENDYSYDIISKVTYYNENAGVKSVIDYQDGEPYNGISYEDGEAEYKNGLLISERKFDDKNTLRLERNPIQNNMTEVKVYDENKKLKYYYTYANLPDAYNFSGNVKSYIAGKEQNATFENGIITKGKIRYTDMYTSNQFELQRKGDWIVKRYYDGSHTLVKETKEKVQKLDEYYGDNRFSEELLTFFTSYTISDGDEMPAPPAIK